MLVIWAWRWQFKLSDGTFILNVSLTTTLFYVPNPFCFIRMEQSEAVNKCNEAGIIWKSRYSYYKTWALSCTRRTVVITSLYFSSEVPVKPQVIFLATSFVYKTLVDFAFKICFYIHSERSIVDTIKEQ